MHSNVFQTFLELTDKALLNKNNAHSNKSKKWQWRYMKWPVAKSWLMDLNWLRAVLAIHRVSGAAEGEALKSTVPAGDVTGTPRRPAPRPITGAQVNRCPFWNNKHFLLLPPQNNLLWNYLYSDYGYIRAALTEGDQLMSSPPFSLMTLWACGSAV